MPKVEVKLWDVVIHRRQGGFNPVLALVVGYTPLGSMLAMYYDEDDKLTGDTFIFVPNLFTRVLNWDQMSFNAMTERNDEYNRRTYELPEYC